MRLHKTNKHAKHLGFVTGGVAGFNWMFLYMQQQNIGYLNNPSFSSHAKIAASRGSPAPFLGWCIAALITLAECKVRILSQMMRDNPKLLSNDICYTSNPPNSSCRDFGLDIISRIWFSFLPQFVLRQWLIDLLDVHQLLDPHNLTSDLGGYGVEDGLHATVETQSHQYALGSFWQTDARAHKGDAEVRHLGGLLEYVSTAICINHWRDCVPSSVESIHVR